MRKLEQETPLESKIDFFSETPFLTCLAKLFWRYFKVENVLSSSYTQNLDQPLTVPETYLRVSAG